MKEHLGSRAGSEVVPAVVPGFSAGSGHDVTGNMRSGPYGTNHVICGRSAATRGPLTCFGSGWGVECCSAVLNRDGFAHMLDLKFPSERSEGVRGRRFPTCLRFSHYLSDDFSDFPPQTAKSLQMQRTRLREETGS